ncbi:MAG: KH domain-containing protein [Candidatus Paceibacterota bacterium]
METLKDREFLEFIVKNLVDHPDDVKIERQVDEMGVLLSVKVNPEDMGQLIGRQGSTAKAIRSLVRIIGLKNHARINLKIEEPEGGSRKRQEETSSSEGSSVTEDFEDFKI